MLSEISNGYTCDLLFLDIELGDATGVEIGKQIRSDIRNESMQIVFVSARESYAMQLFDIRPMNFLVKPVEYSDGIITNKIMYTEDAYDYPAFMEKVVGYSLLI